MRDLLHAIILVLIILLAVSWVSLRDAEDELAELKSVNRFCNISFKTSVATVPCQLINNKLAKVEM